MSNILYTYGTLRSGEGRMYKAKGVMYDLGWFPGVRLGGTKDFVVERAEVDDWSDLDRYEGYYPEDLEGSLFIRRPFMDGFIYELNREGNPVKQILSGDWLDYNKEKGLQ